MRDGRGVDEDNCRVVVGVFSVPPGSSTAHQHQQTTFRAYSADKQLRSALGPPGGGQHGQAPRGALAHEQPHFAADPTLMQPEPVSRQWDERPPRSTPGNGVPNVAFPPARLPESRLFLPSCNTRKQEKSVIETERQ